jgi:hypothetical protein
VAVNDLAADIVTEHAPVPVHGPLQPENIDPLAGTAVKLTTVPES